jgi:hypothetical protein
LFAGAESFLCSVVRSESADGIGACFMRPDGGWTDDPALNTPRHTPFALGANVTIYCAPKPAILSMYLIQAATCALDCNLWFSEEEIPQMEEKP